MLKLLAGETAYQRIQEKGFGLADISMWLGASGGPKWLMLSELDKYFCSEWLPNINQSMELVGSSIGAWRMAMYASRNPSNALDDFMDAYLKQSYSEGMTPKDISQYIRDKFIGAVSDIDLNNPKHNLNLVTARCRGPFSYPKDWVQSSAFVGSAATNIASGKTLNWFYERVTFALKPDQSIYQTLPISNNRIVGINQHNLDDALMATGAIPMVIGTIKDIHSAPKGVYIDGGMIDYHFNLPFKPKNGIVFYPHFSPTIKPGWFDKMLPWRMIDTNAYSHTLVTVPSSEFVASLPYNKIPDRKDFQNMDDDTRTKYWKTVLDQTKRLVEDIHNIQSKNLWQQRVELLTKESLRSA